MLLTKTSFSCLKQLAKPIITNRNIISKSALLNSTVSFGGISLALGATDATPAFDLADATNYPTSSFDFAIGKPLVLSFEFRKSD